MGVIRGLRGRAHEAARRLWMKYALRGVRQADAHGRLDLAYKIEDPWHMDAAREQFRFAETNRIIEAHLAPRLDRVLEIGCGEGHQSEWLARLTDGLTGIDVSPTAVARARRRVPSGDFVAGDLFAQPWSDERGRFDLVTACEVLYYMSDMPRFLRAMDQLGGACLVTYFSAAGRLCERPVMAMPGAQQVRFRHEDTEWIAAWWTGAARRA
jgi:cyclopropane fatty-acyl-phospholipid synthase-like methyltransferase